MKDNPLGKHVDNVDSYDPGLLFSIKRCESRAKLGVFDKKLPFSGIDIWNAYEISWLDLSGCPVVACGVFTFPANSTQLIESKSFKLYLNSYNNSQFASRDVISMTLEEDLSKVAGSRVEVELREVSYNDNVSRGSIDGLNLDTLKINTDIYHVEPSLLRVKPNHNVEEKLYSNLFRSLCPVTSQPDWGSVVIAYKGREIDHDGLLKYIVSFRNHQGFHEDCAERIFIDISKKCEPEHLVVAMYFLRRGGLDINPVRSSGDMDLSKFKIRFQRQ